MARVSAESILVHQKSPWRSFRQQVNSCCRRGVNSSSRRRPRLQLEALRREAMLEPGAVSAVPRLKELGFATRRLRARLGPSQTVKSYVEAGAWRTYKQPARWEERAGWGRGLSAIAATGTSFARS
jgi:hypothetical protein